MKGLMQDWPLLVHRVLDHAACWHSERQVVSRTVEGPIHRYTYKDLDQRSRAVADAARKRLGIKYGSVIGTMAWNGYRHLEIWYGIMGLGAVVHTLNPRLFADQLVYIVNHAEDEWLFIDLTFVSVFEKLQDQLKSVKGFIVMTDKSHMPETSLRNAICYEELISEGNGGFEWPEFDENTACGLCYTSGTTGNPKGVLYSHRSNVLHAMMACAADALAIHASDTVMPVVPMFHANTWSLAYSAPMAGAGLVLPGPKLGGAACPEALMRAFTEKYGTKIIHAWGMTETSPLGTLCRLKPGQETLSLDEQWKTRIKQGRPTFTVEMKIVNDANDSLPHDGKTFGRLKVRGPAISSAYFKGEGASAFDDEGWFDTGDVSTVDPLGFMQITDRSKDVIKSGGEWISSIELENVAVACEGVLEAAAIGLPHPKWDERPLLVVVRKPGATVTREQVLAHLNGKIAKWWMPDDVTFADDIPHTATGKISKLQLRDRFKDYRFPGV